MDSIGSASTAHGFSVDQYGWQISWVFESWNFERSIVSDTFVYRGRLYPAYLKDGNAMQYIAPTALKFCKGHGLDIGAGIWPLPGAEKIDPALDIWPNIGEWPDDAYHLPSMPEGWDYIFSSHCLEHLDNPVRALEHWKLRLRPSGVLFIYLPHPEMEYWRPQWNRKHLHSWTPEQMAQMLRDLGFADVLHGERDLAWSFAVVGWKP